MPHHHKNAPPSSLWKLFTEIATYGAGGILLRLSGLIITMVIARILEVDEYGRLELLLTSATIVTAFVSLQSEGGLLRFFHLAGDKRPQLLFTHLLAVSIGGGLVTLFVVTAAPTIASYWPEQGFSPAEIRLAGALVLGHLLYNHTITCQRAARQPAYAVGTAVGTSLLQLILIIILIHWFGGGPEEVIGARLIAEIGAFVAVLYLGKQNYHLRPSWYWFRELLSYSLPLALETFISLVLFHFTRYFLSGRLGPTALGFFGVAGRAASVVALITASIKGGWLPYAFSEEGSPQANQNFVKVFKIYVKCGGWGVAFVSLFSPLLITILASQKYQAATSMVGPLAAAQFLQGASYFLNTPLLITKRTGLYTVASAAGAVAVVGANLFMVPWLNGLGAAMAQATGILILDLILFLIGQQVLAVGYPIGYIFIPYVVGIVSGLGENIVSHQLNLLTRIFIGAGLVLIAFHHMRKEIGSVISAIRENSL